VRLHSFFMKIPQVDWLELERIVADETAAGNPVASLIVNMDLAHSRITLRYERVPAQCFTRMPTQTQSMGRISLEGLALR
jgi:hypothetical protein